MRVIWTTSDRESATQALALWNQEPRQREAEDAVTKVLRAICEGVCTGDASHDARTLEYLVNHAEVEEAVTPYAVEYRSPDGVIRTSGLSGDEIRSLRKMGAHDRR